MATMTTAMRVYLLLAAIVAWAGLLLQLNVSLTIFSDRGLSAAFTVFRMLGYFTILTNLIVASYYTARLLARASPMVEWLASPVVASWIALSISFVAVVYALLLRHLVNLAGWALVADVVLHYVTPALFVFYWVVFVPKGQLRWRHALLWAVYPLGYVTYALIRGALSGFYPYPFLDVTALGLPRVLLNVVALQLIFWIAGLLVVGIDRYWRSGRSHADTRAPIDSR
jgi:hypothetical protein